MTASSLRPVSLATTGTHAPRRSALHVVLCMVCRADATMPHVAWVALCRKWVFIRHVISRGKTVCAVGITKIVLKEPSGKTIPPAIAFKMCGYTDVETMAGASAVAAGRALSTTHIPMADRIDTLQSEAGDDWLSMESNLNPAAKM